MDGFLKVVSPDEVKGMAFDPVDPTARTQAASILKEVKENGLEGLLDVAVRLKDIESRDSKLFFDRGDLEKAYSELPEHDRLVLERTAQRIRTFAEAQRKSITEMVIDIPGGQAGHSIAPVRWRGATPLEDATHCPRQC